MCTEVGEKIGIFLCFDPMKKDFSARSVFNSVPLW